MLFDPLTTEHDKMAALSYREYLLQVERNPTAFSGRRVLAAVLMKSPSSDVTVLSLGTGDNYLYHDVAVARSVIDVLWAWLLSWELQKFGIFL